MFFRPAFIVPFLFLAVTAGAHGVQTSRQFASNYNGWFMYFGTHKFSPKWVVHAEVQLRRSSIIIDDQQLLIRTGLNYHMTPRSFITAGYCFVETYPYGKLPA